MAASCEREMVYELYQRIYRCPQESAFKAERSRPQKWNCIHVKLSSWSAMMLKAYHRFQTVSLLHWGVFSETFRDCENKQAILNNQGFCMAVPTKTQTQKGLMWHFICSGLGEAEIKWCMVSLRLQHLWGVCDSSAFI